MRTQVNTTQRKKTKANNQPKNNNQVMSYAKRTHDYQTNDNQ